MSYRDELKRAMALIAKQENSIFVGQSVRYSGQAAFPTFADVPMDKRIELPVAEDFQAGFCAGLAMAGFLPLCFYPRWDFALLAANQIVNHIDKAAWLGWPGKVIIRTAVGWKRPYDQGPQHRQNYAAAFRVMCETVGVFDASSESDVMAAYKEALASDHSSIIVERIPMYGR